ncbi:hypothetical protein JCM10207_005152 [Rhodosporidiobolus poonsookiae]
MSATVASPTALPTSASDGGDHLTFNIYGYNPSLAAAIVFIIAFSLITIYQTVLVARSRIWWLSVLIVGGVGEILGWAGRLWAAKNPYSLNAFLTQIVSLIISPCFFSATIYGILGMIVRSIGREYSLLKPWLYLTIFCLADLIAIVIQAIGGAKAALALQNNEDSVAGTHIMVAGIAVQLAAMIAFCILGLDVWRRARKNRSYQNRPHSQSERLTIVAYGLTWASVWILIRCIYRVIELAEGWDGNLMTHEPYFCILDAMAMVFAQGVFCFTWPSNEKGFRSKGDEVLPRVSSSSSQNTRADQLGQPAGEKVQTA